LDLGLIGLQAYATNNKRGIMARSESKLDCLIIGHNEIEFGLVEERLKWTQRHSGSYDDLKANSINFHGRRITYMNLLNEMAINFTAVLDSSSIS
jgi:hypothetical protein